MDERPTYSYIPKNLNNTGGLFGGAVDTRRLVEAVISAGIIGMLYKFLSIYIHNEALLYICLVLGIFLGGACLIGGNGEPLSVFLFNFINYENRRIFVTLRPPMPDFEDAKKEKKEPSGLEARLMRLLPHKDKKDEGGGL